MRNVTETKHITASANSVWSKIGSFGGIGAWHPLLARVETERDGEGGGGEGDAPGAVRKVQGKDGSKLVERLEQMDEQRHAYRYSLQSGPLPVRNYTADLCVDDAGEDASTVTWSAQFEVTSGEHEKVVETIRKFMRVGLDALPQAVGSSNAAGAAGTQSE